MASFPERLKNLRLKFGYRQKDVASKLGISEAAYGYYEQGKREPSQDVLIRLADIFEVSTDYILGRQDVGSLPNENPLGIELNETELQTLREILNDPDVTLFFKDFAALGERDRRKVLAMIKAWREEG